jgi:nucleotidyltransferase substrate binding protein (TIGR01987 family)
MIIDTSSFKQAISRLDEALQRYEQESQDLAVKDSVVKRFEYTYALAYKTLGRFLKAVSGVPKDIDIITLQELVRDGNEMGLLKGDIKDWLEYHKKRNLTPHAYDNDTANKIITIVPKFYEEAKFLLERIEERNNAFRA